eukprot:430120_1
MSIRLKQRTQAASCCAMPMNVPALQWNYTKPTPLLQQNGLTSDTLQQELNNINQKSTDIMIPINQKRKCCCCTFLTITCLGIFLILLGLDDDSNAIEDDEIDDTDGTSNWIIPSLWIIGVVFLVCGFVFVLMLAGNAFENKFVGEIREYVELHLNNKYQTQYGIKWQLFDTSTECIDRTLTETHIDIVCLDSTIPTMPNVMQEITRLKVEVEYLKSLQSKQN